MVHHRAEARSLGLTAEELLAELESELRTALAARPAVRSIGLGIPCTIDRERGVAISAVNLPIVNMPIRDLMSERLGLPVEIDNDGNVAALAEHRWGAARGATNAVLLTIGTGIGGGLILDRRGLPGDDRRRRRARPHRDRGRRSALSGQLPEPRLRRGGRLRNRPRPRGAGGRGAAPGLRDRPPAGGGRDGRRARRDDRGDRRRPGIARRRCPDRPPDRGRAERPRERVRARRDRARRRRDGRRRAAAGARARRAARPRAATDEPDARGGAPSWAPKRA